VIRRDLGIVTAIVVWLCLAAYPATAEESTNPLHHKLPAGAVLVGPLQVQGETVAGLTIASAAAEAATEGPTSEVPVQWAGPEPVGFVADLRATITPSPTSLFVSAQAQIDLDLTADPARPLVVRGRVDAAQGASAGHRTEFTLITPRVASAEEFIEYIQDPAMRPLDAVFSCTQPEGAVWKVTFPVGGVAHLTTPDGRDLANGTAASMTSVSIVNGETTRTYRSQLTFGDEPPIRLDVVFSGPEACDSAGAGSGTGAQGAAGALLDCMGDSGVPGELHSVDPGVERGVFDEAPPPIATCTFSVVQYGFDRPAR
jgi:hypothetical protein